MWMRRAQERCVDQTRQRHVVRVGGAALHQLSDIGARNGTADIAVGQILSREADLLWRDGLVHQAIAPLMRWRATSSTASTMA